MLIFVLGSSGIFGLEELRLYRERLSDNLLQLKEINSDLLAERDALLHDSSEVELRARTLGYRRRNEIRIKLPHSTKNDYYRKLGGLIRRDASGGEDYDIFRLIAMCAACSLYGVLTLIAKARNGRRKRFTRHPSQDD